MILLIVGTHKVDLIVQIHLDNVVIVARLEPGTYNVETHVNSNINVI